MLLDTPVCDFGWKAPEFTLNDALSNTFTMSDQLGKKGLLVMFLCNHCPYVQAIGDRLAEDTNTLMDHGVNVLAVMSNDYRYVPIDGPKHMPQFAAKYGWNFPYLVDEGQHVGKAYGAVCTPDFFGFNNDGGLQYRGRLDDARMGGSPSNRNKELVTAMKQIAATGQGPRQQTPSMGCSIKWG
jgi:peroxiredoxin